MYNRDLPSFPSPQKFEILPRFLSKISHIFKNTYRSNLKIVFLKLPNQKKQFKPYIFPSLKNLKISKTLTSDFPQLPFYFYYLLRPLLSAQEYTQSIICIWISSNREFSITLLSLCIKLLPMFRKSPISYLLLPSFLEFENSTSCKKK